MNKVEYFRHLVEYLEGQQDEPPAGFPLSLKSPLWGVIWMVLMVLIVLFCGQSSKFIYIDF